MVDISIFIEGGVLPNDNISVQTIDNSDKLREGFYSILSQLVPSTEFNIKIKQGSSNKQTINFFKTKIKKDANSSLLIDLDCSKHEKATKLSEFELTGYSENVFFMVQEMEAWIISQIDKVDAYYKNKLIRKRTGIALSNHHKIVNIHPEDIVKPSTVLKEILGYYFITKFRKKKKYGKLKDGSILLSLLNANDLQTTFEDFDNLINKINALNNSVTKQK